MRKQERALAAVEALKTLYPDALCSLTETDPFRLLVAVRLSAQCTDARVNMVTPALFERYPTVRDMAGADPAEVGEYIRSCGFYNTKSKDLVNMAKRIVDDFAGVVPESMEDLTSLPGVGRKTANLIRGDVYGLPAVVADTHFIRLCNRLDFVRTRDPYKVELAMAKLLPPAESNDFCHRAVLFGRDVCTARKAHCERCPMEGFCPKKI